jgi:tight adherence protein C
VLQRSAQERAVEPLAGALARFARRLTPVGWVESLERRITLAGRPAAWPIERVLIAKLVLAAVASALGFLVFADRRTFLWLVFWVGATALAYFAPDLLLYSRGEERQEEIDKALPDTLDQMTITVEAGLGFESAMARAGRTGKGALAQEIVRSALTSAQRAAPSTRFMAARGSSTSG